MLKLFPEITGAMVKKFVDDTKHNMVVESELSADWMANALQHGHIPCDSWSEA